MKSSFLVIGAVLLFASVAAASDVPTAETFLAYNFVRYNPNSGFIPSFNVNGGNGRFAYNFNKWIGAVVDLAETKGIGPRPRGKPIVDQGENPQVVR